MVRSRLNGSEHRLPILLDQVQLVANLAGDVAVLCSAVGLVRSVRGAEQAHRLRDGFAIAAYAQALHLVFGYRGPVDAGLYRYAAGFAGAVVGFFQALLCGGHEVIAVEAGQFGLYAVALLLLVSLLLQEPE